MPVYEFICPVCEARFEKRVPWSQADEPQQCPNGHAGARRVPNFRPMVMSKISEDPYKQALPGTSHGVIPERSDRIKIEWRPRSPERSVSSSNGSADTGTPSTAPTSPS